MCAQVSYPESYVTTQVEFELRRGMLQLQSAAKVPIVQVCEERVVNASITAQWGAHPACGVMRRRSSADCMCTCGNDPAP